MSRFTAYCDWVTTARKCLDGEQPPYHPGGFRVGGKSIDFPLEKVESSSLIADFYEGMGAEVERSRLRDRRKKLYTRFSKKVVVAHAAVEDVGVSKGTVMILQDSLAHLDVALRLMTDLIEYDNENPIHWSEVFPTEDARSQLSPSELWLYFKLESVRPCLVFLVRLLRLILPDCLDLWCECEESLRSELWMVRFILDSQRPPRKSTSVHFPKTHSNN
ncbi:hypothetical protein F5Y11DRAFT_291483 [Daldinia sp. FL1419]|nr:hypothetical protein F5Y11DRAFT_291483 [Daldinia sp. FL1419]